MLEFFDDFNAMELFKKIKSGDMRLEEKLEDEFTNALENIKLLYESQKAVIKLFDDGFSIA